MKYPRLFSILAVLLVTLSTVGFAQMPETNSITPSITRIVYVGDSITVGVGVNDAATERYSSVATRLLADTHAGFTEINLGQSSRALCQQITDYAEGVLSHLPDAVVIQWGVNDQYWGFSLAEFIARYEDLVATLRATKPHIPIVIMTLIADFRQADNQDVWIGDANVALQDIAARHRCHLADTHRALNHQDEYYSDLIHPNAAGAEVMAKAVVAALDSPPLSPENASISFDQGAEVRFLQNVFRPIREGPDPQWIHVTGINSNGMTIDSKIPVAIRTAPIYPEGTYRIASHDKSGAIVDSIKSSVNWSQMQVFTFDPKDHQGPFRIEIIPEPEAVK